MTRINFTKMVASGNDFVVIDQAPKKTGLSALSRKICDRKFGVGADGLLLVRPYKKRDIIMRIFNADGSEAEMCGNGARCAVYFSNKKNPTIKTMAGLVESKTTDSGKIKIRLTNPSNLKEKFFLNANNKSLEASFINTGVPHTVIILKNLDKIDVNGIGRKIRFHKRFVPKGTNVNFVKIVNSNTIRVRTYERGVEDETLACGTGATASALIAALKLNSKKKVISVHTRSKDVLKIYFDRINNHFTNVWLEGGAKIAYKGVYNA